MLEKLIAYLQGLGEAEKKKLEEVLQEEGTTEQTEEPQEEDKQGKNVTSEQKEQPTTQGMNNVEEKKEESRQTENENVEEKKQEEVQTQEPKNVLENQGITEEKGEVSQELLDTKIELGLIRLGIREDRLEAAKRLFKTEVQSEADLEKLKELVKEFPEWQKAKKEQGAGFGANLKDNGNSLTEEEKKLKSMGIDPKN